MALTPPYDVLVPWCKLPANVGLTDGQRYQALLAVNVNKILPLSSATLLGWAAGAGILAAIEDASRNTQISGILRSVARAAMLMLERDGTVLDLNLADRMAMVDGMVAGGIITADNKTSLVALATIQVSQIQAWGVTVYPAQLASARDLITQGN